MRGSRLTQALALGRTAARYGGHAEKACHGAPPTRGDRLRSPRWRVIHAGLLVAISASVGCAPAQLRGPRLTGGGAQYALRLPPEMHAALDAYDPAFRPWAVEHYHPGYVRGYEFSRRQAMFAVIGDFNGDRRPDVAIDGHTPSRRAIVVVLSERTGYRVVEIQGMKLASGDGERPGRADVYLGYTAPGRIESPVCDTSCVLDLRTDAFSVTYDEKAGEVWYYLNGKFHRFATGD